MFLIRSAVILTIFLFTNSHLIGSGWPQPKGSYFIKLSEWWMISDHHFGQDGSFQRNIQEYGYFSTSLYASYSFTNRFTGILHYPFINYLYVAPSSARPVWATGDTEIGLKYGLLQKDPFALSLTAFAGIPSGKARGSLAGGLQTGDGEFNQGILLDAAAGFKFFKTNGWLGLKGGFNNRTKQHSDEILYGLEGGINLSANKIVVILRLQGLASDEKGSAPLNAQSLFSNNREYVNLSPELIYNFDDRWSLFIGMGIAVSGKNIFANTSYTVGMIHQKNNYATEDDE